MITNEDLVRTFDAGLLRSLCCPVCLHDLAAGGQGGARQLVCVGCNSPYAVVDGLPILLVEDTNWRKKEDEIRGEVAYNTDGVSPSVHVERNAFVDENTAELLQDARLDLAGDRALVVGCSMAELAFFVTRTRQLSCLDIVPRLALLYLQGTRNRGLNASWVCGDGEALPYESESFDTVIVRQALHHMLDYGAAVREFFRVCRLGGTILLIDEPFTPADRSSPPLTTGADEEHVFGDVKLGHARQALGLPPRPRAAPRAGTAEGFRARDGYVEPVAGDPESMLADKYSTLSLLGLLAALRPETDDVRLFWLRRVGWAKGVGSALRFGHGPNLQRDKPLVQRLIEGGNTSLVARKLRRSHGLRDRTSLRATPVEKCLALARMAL